MERQHAEIAEVVVRFDGIAHRVLYVAPGDRLRAGPTPKFEVAWPDPFELFALRAGEPILARTLTLGAMRIEVRPTPPPLPRDLAPRIDWRRLLGILFVPLFVTTVGLGLGTTQGTRRPVALDEDAARRLVVKLDAPTNKTAPARSQRVVAARTNPFIAGSEWRGRYVCGQGLTDLSLRIEHAAGDSFDAIFDFDFAQGRTKGWYYVQGTFDPDTGHAHVDPMMWIDQPPGWFMVGLDGTASRTHFAGTVTGQGCTVFALDAAQ